MKLLIISSGALLLATASLLALLWATCSDSPKVVSLDTHMLNQEWQEFPSLQITDLRLAGTIAQEATVTDILGFDDFIYREFSSSRSRYSVYLATWADRRRHYLEVSTHAPDNCWVSGGWELVASPSPDMGNLLAGRFIAPNYRVFRVNKTVKYVMFWHLLNGSSLDYQRYGQGRTLRFVWDNREFLYPGTGEQYFIRVSSDLPLEKWKDDPLFEEILERISMLAPIAVSEETKFQ